MAFQITSIRSNITRSRSGHSTLTIRAYGTVTNDEGRSWKADRVVYKAVKLDGPEQAANLARAFKEHRDEAYLQQYSHGDFQGFVTVMPTDAQFAASLQPCGK